MIEPSELDMAQFKFEMRTMVKNLTTEAAFQVVHEMLIGARVLLEVVLEERSLK